MIMNGKMNFNGIYILEGNTIIGMVAISQTLVQGDDQIDLWHRKLRHMSAISMSVLNIQGLFGGVDTINIKFCEARVKGKLHKVKFGTGQHTSKEILEYVHSDLWSPSLVKYHGGC